jgi:sn-glycerol 3-phosphate transport system substrate-binding protein
MKPGRGTALMAAVTLALVLAAGMGFASPASESEAAGPVKIVYWRSLTGVPGDAQDELVKRFNASQTRVVAEAQFQGAYAEILQKLMAALAAQSVPDLVLLDSPFVVLFAKDGALVALDRFASDARAGVDLKAFVPGLLQDGYYKGKLYALPFMRSTPLLYFNRDMFAEVGLPDRVPDTWNDYREYSRKMTKQERWGSAFEMGTTTAHWYLQGAIYAYGGEVSDDAFAPLLESRESIAAAQLWQDLVFKDKVAIAGTEQGGAQGSYLNSRVGMAFGSTGSMANLMGRAKFKVGSGFMPAQARRMVPVGGSVLAMTSTDKARQAGSWEFMKFVTSPASNAYIVLTTGYMPTSKAALEHADTVSYFQKYPDRRIAVDQLQYARPQASVVSLGKGTEILRQAVEKLLVGNVPAPQVMKETSADLRKEYQEAFK